jgi:hypothetical protein
MMMVQMVRVLQICAVHQAVLAASGFVGGIISMVMCNPELVV